MEVPGYLTAELGERLTSPRGRGIWDRTAVRIEHYGVSFDIADQPRTLGDRPHDLRARAAYDQARPDIAMAKKQLARERARRWRRFPATPTDDARPLRERLNDLVVTHIKSAGIPRAMGFSAR